MNNKKIGIIVIILSIIVLVIVIFFRMQLVDMYMSHIIEVKNGICSHTGPTCPFKEVDSLLWPTIAGSIVVILFLAIGIYLIFFEKSQKILEKNQENIVQSLKDTKKQKDNEEKFELILSALDNEEKKVMTAVKEQDGITQATLRIRTNLSKTKLSMILSGLEKKDLIKKVAKGKTNQVFLKKQI